MSKILNVYAKEMLDSRGNPTLEAEVWTELGGYGTAMVPSGASTGEYEAVELRDADTGRYSGKGVKRAVRNVNEIIKPLVVGLNSTDQALIDKTLIDRDGTDNKSLLGANAMLGVSLAAARAAANELKAEFYEYIGGLQANTLPAPMMNILNGGAHADNNLDIQEFMIFPLGFARYSEALRAGVEIYHSLKSVLKKNGLSTGVGDEGGFAPNLKSNAQALEIMSEAVRAAGYSLDKEVFFALDVAASEFYDEEKKLYRLKGEERSLTSDEMIEYYEELVKNYPIVSIEDGLDENDWEGWKKLTKKLGNKIQLVGDDLFVTNTKKLQRGFDEEAANAVLVKPNQIGTLTETMQTVKLAKNNGYNTIISHRSGETEDTTIADLAVALSSGQIKTGAPCRTDRVAKYNRLLRIEQYLGLSADYSKIPLRP